mgnify:FL=1
MINKYPSLLVLGSTGSVGRQSLDVARAKKIGVLGISANKNVKETEAQAREFGVRYVAMADRKAADELRIKLADTSAKVYDGADGICSMIEDSDAEAVVNSILGEAGLMPTLATIRTHKKLALANKESLVVAGRIVTDELKKYHGELVPVDSEHCAIHQCLRAGTHGEIKNLILTASGGPFYGYSKGMLGNITVAQTLNHPTWKMGAKITVDSATLMNKGFEVIEAAHLFDVDADMVEVLVHRESIIHSMVEYIDNSVIAQLSVPDMRHCVQYALTYPVRDTDSEGETKALRLADIGKLTFGKPDTDTFVLLKLAGKALSDGGAMPAVVNAANEIAVDAFLHERIGFCGIADTVCETYEKMSSAAMATTLTEITECDRQARAYAEEKVATARN